MARGLIHHPYRLAAWLLAASALGCVHIPDRKEIDQSQTYYDLAVNGLNFGHYEDALDNFQRSIALNPGFADAHNGLGLVWWHKAKIDAIQEDYEKARLEFERAVELRPGFSDAWNSLGAFSIERQDYARAIDAFKAALSDPMYKTPYVPRSNLGWVYHLQHKDKEALAQIREAILSEPSYCVGHKQLALVLTDLNRLDEAEREWTAFAHYCPDDPDAEFHSGQIHQAHGDLESAAKDFFRCQIQAAKLNPSHMLIAQCTDAGSKLPQLPPEDQDRIKNEVYHPEATHTDNGSDAPSTGAP